MSVVSQFNARNTDAELVAKGFVVPSYFNEVTPFRNVILVGPRGIGKTTLLKSLTSPGLTVLHRRPDLRSVLAGTDFDSVPIYIPAESIWKGTAGLVREEIAGALDQELILGGLFRDHCLYQLLSSFEQAANQYPKLLPGEAFPWVLNLSPEVEAKICAECSDLWEIPKVQRSFLGLKLQLLKRSNLYRAAIDQSGDSKDLDEVRRIGKIDFLLMLKGFLDIVEVCHGAKRWTVSFDEMEIAPKPILAHLFQNLRSFDQRVALKFSLFPYVDFYEERGGFISTQSDPTHGDDFHPVILSSKFSNDKNEFSQNLIASECARRGYSFGQFMQYLNSSKGIISGSRVFSEKGFERKPAKIFDYILQNSGDPGLRRHLAAKGITSSADIDSVKGETKRAEVIRKVFPIAEIRAYYLSQSVKTSANGRQVRRSSAKGYGYYHGYSQLLAITEGNPRAIKYFLNDLLDDMEANRDPNRAQNAAIPQNVDRFRAMVASQAVPVMTLGRGDPSALRVIDSLGRALADGVLSETFHPEPPLSFRLRNIHPNLKEGLISAVNSGALIVEESASGKKLLFDLEGCRVRISHRLAPFYKLPTVTGQERPLSVLPEHSSEGQRQPDLLAWGELSD